MKSIELKTHGKPHIVVVPEEVSEDWEPLDKGDWWFLGITIALIVAVLAWLWLG